MKTKNKVDSILKKTFFAIILPFLMISIVSCFTLKKSATGVSDAERQLLLSSGLPLAIFEYSSGNPNSAGGVSVFIDWQNISEKEIKYLTFTVVPYNRVNDIAPSSIGNTIEAHLRATGPFSSNHIQKNTGYRNVWYNSTISYIKIVGIEIIYMDDETLVFDENQILKMIIK